MTSLDDLVAKVAGCAPGRLAILCGAGVSLRSGLPTVYPLLGRILGHLPATDGDREKLLGRQGLPMPFESFMEVFLDNSRDPGLLDVFRIGSPNPNHHLLAHLSGRLARDVYTTNFDLLIEGALRAAGLDEGADYSVLFREEHFLRVSHAPSSGPSLCKLHGSIADTESVRATLAAVSGRTLTSQRENAIRRMLSGGLYDLLVIMGYSCSDHFDINPAIETAPGPTPEILLIEHRVDGPDPECEPIGQHGAGHPFAGYRGWRVRVDTDRFVSALAARLGLRLVPGEPPERRWEEVVDQWASRFPSDHTALTIVGQLFYRLSMSEEALRYYERALESNRARNEVRNMGAVLNNMGLVHANAHKHELAAGYYQQALECFRQIGFAFGMAAAYGNLGFAYAYIDPEASLRNSRQAVRIARAHGFRAVRANALNNMGLVHKRGGDYRRAIRYYRASLAANEGSDPQNDVITLSNIGNAHRLMGDPAAAERYLLRAVDLARKIGYTLGEAQSLRFLAEAYAARGDAARQGECERNARELVDRYSLQLH